MSSKPGGDIGQYVLSANQVMTSSNYNELDSFVFAELSYVKYESSEISWSSSELENGISAKLFAKRILDQGKNCIYEEQRVLLTSIANSERYSQCTITDLAASNGKEMWHAGKISTMSDDAQWGAMKIQMNDGSGSEVIAMRGTNGTKLGWGEDMELGFERYGTTHQRLSRDYLSSSKADRIYMTGHSKGGNACTSAYMMSEPDVRDRVISIDNFDGPGHNDEFIKQYVEGYRELNNKQHNYYPRHSIVGQLLTNNPGSSRFVSADTTGHMENEPIIGQHDPFAWEFEQDENGNYCGFKSTKQSELSKAVDRAIDSSLKGLSSREKSDTLKALLKLGIHNFIAHDKDYDYLDYSSFKSLIMSIMSDKGLTFAEMRALLSIVLSILTSFAEYELIKTQGFYLPDIDKLYYMIRDWEYDRIRNMKDSIRDFLNWIKYGGSDKAPKEESGYNPPDNVHQMYDFRNHDQGRYSSSVRRPVSFAINCESLSNGILRFKELSDDLFYISEELLSMEKNCDANGLTLLRIPISAVANIINETSSNAKTMGTALDNVLKEYQNTEKTIQAEMLA